MEIGRQGGKEAAETSDEISRQAERENGAAI
jgi:hypothetical protein